MKASVTLAECRLPNGARLSLHEHDGEHVLRVAGQALMSTRASASEEQLADLACERVRGVEGARVLIGGLGLGFTLRRVLDVVAPSAAVEVAELVPEVVAWNREHLRAVNGAALDDARVTVAVADVLDLLRRAGPGAYDAVLLDVDNGPDALVARSNRRLYGGGGLRSLARALRADGRAVFWSAAPDAGFARRLEHAGFRVRVERAKAYAQARRDAHVLFVCDLAR